MGLLLTSYPQVRNYLREKNSKEEGIEAKRKADALLKVQELEKEQLEAEIFKKREEAFKNAFGTENEQQKAIEEWTNNAPWIRNKQGEVARHFAINAWASQKEE